MSSFEPVLMIWDFYDGPRSGLAEYNGRAHYYKCLWDNHKNNYSDMFELSPVRNSFLEVAKTNWEIYRAWQLKYDAGEVASSTHPGYRGNDLEYDRLEDKLTTEIKNLSKLTDTFIPTFRARSNQDHLPNNVERVLEALWLKLD